MKRLPMPGVYSSEDGTLHIDITELLTAAGYADTSENRAVLLKEFRNLRLLVHETDDPIDPEKR